VLRLPELPELRLGSEGEEEQSGEDEERSAHHSWILPGSAEQVWRREAQNPLGPPLGRHSFAATAMSAVQTLGAGPFESGSARRGELISVICSIRGQAPFHADGASARKGACPLIAHLLPCLESAIESGEDRSWAVIAVARILGRMPTPVEQG